uniref:Uncharacterized protein AlNc14C142G7297 n=1 Tax=Albugo laibachii Nc14 TaxID=890382 RepID=F0WLA9_9STRA|nr:conserved hypothetical protein [Albugo laibachii Nc14]|eukprot:CCA22071.1 conserved hypothetical protein [Albugo laibachii Nc14]
MGNQSSRTGEPGRQPNDHEMMILYRLQKSLYTRLIQSPQHLSLLESLWNLTHQHKSGIKFEPISEYWKWDAGFSSCNPGDDLRSMGELGLRCLIYFVQNHYTEFTLMRRRRGGYPFAKSAMAVARSICQVFYLVDLDGHPGRFPIQLTLYWQLLHDEMVFYKLFGLFFFKFEELYCDWVAQHRSKEINNTCSIGTIILLVENGKQLLLGELNKAPTEVSDLARMCGNGVVVVSKRAKPMERIDGAQALTSSVWKIQSKKADMHSARAKEALALNLFAGLLEKSVHGTLAA